MGEPGPATPRPVDRYGKLQVRGTDLCDETGEPVQLVGMSSHGLQWFGHDECLTPASLDALASDWRADVFRVAMYVHEGGYLTDPAGYRRQVHDVVEMATERGLYVVLDWHTLDPGDPRMVGDEAVAFFDEMAETYAGRDDVLYEICNEPNGVGWPGVREYADDVVAAVREHDEDGVVLIGTPAWSSLGFSEDRDPRRIVEDPVPDDDVLYTFHFYAASHGEAHREVVRDVADELPLFVSEWGTQEHTGDGPNDFESARAWLDLFEAETIGWVNWNYSDDHRSGAVWRKGTCPDGPWTEENLVEAGQWVRRQIRSANGSGGEPAR